MATYTYSKSADFPNQAVNLGDLEDEIRASVIVTALDYVSLDADIVDIVFKASLSSGDETELDNLVGAHVGSPTPVKVNPAVSERGGMKVEPQPPTGSRRTIVTHDWTDPTTWYEDSGRATDEVLDPVPNSNYTRYRSVNKNWINLYEGKIVDEDDIRINGPYDITIKVNDETKVIGVDFIVDYTTGEITLEWMDTWGNTRGLGALTDTDEVKATYSYAQSSVFTIKPSTGKVLRVAQIEVQFTQDVIIKTDTIFAAYAYNPMDLPNKVEVPGTRDIYKGARDFISVGNQGVGDIAPFGGVKRGLLHKVNVFPFDYQAATDLKDSIGLELKMWLGNDVPHEGEYSSATLYCIEEDENA